MSRFTLQQGLRVLISGKEFEIRRRVAGGQLQLESVTDGELLNLTNSEIQAKYFKEELRFVANQDPGGESLENTLARKLERDLARAPESKVAAIKRCLAYVKAVDRAGLMAFTKERIAPIVKRVAAELGDTTSAPSWISVWRWHKRYILSGRDARALLSASDKRGNRKPRLHPELYAIGRRARDEIFLSEERKSIADVKARITVLVDDLNRFRDPEEKLPYPGYSFIEKIIQEVDPYDLKVARFGKRAAEVAFRTSMAGPRPTRPLERVEIDHTKADLFVIDDRHMLPLGRPWITVCVDVHTKCPLGFYVGFEPPSTLSIMACLKHAILPKTYVKECYPEIINGWACHGLMETLVCDNGVEFHSSHLELACLRFGIDLQFTKVKVPWFKGSIERFLRTLSHDLLHGQPGTTFSNIFEREEYDPAKHAVITLKQLDEMLHRWIIDIYCQRSQGRGKDADMPAHRWETGILHAPPALPCGAKELDVVLGKTVIRSLHHYGIELFEGLYYNSDALGALRRKHGNALKVLVTYNSRDIARLFVSDPGTEQHLEVPSLDPAYTTGLSEWAHRVNHRYVREKLNERVDGPTLMRAREAIRQIVASGIGRSGNRTRQRAARFEGVDNSDVLSLQARSLRLDAGNNPPPPVGEQIEHPSTKVIAHTPLPTPRLADRTMNASTDPRESELPQFDVDYGLPRSRRKGDIDNRRS